MGGKLTQLIKNEINFAAEQNRPLKYLLFVAHDTTIAAQLKILGHVVDDIPPYASALNYSLFDMGGSYLIRVSYDEVPLIIELCGGDTCFLDSFIRIIDNQLNNY